MRLVEFMDDDGNEDEIWNPKANQVPPQNVFTYHSKRMDEVKQAIHTNCKNMLAIYNSKNTFLY